MMVNFDFTKILTSNFLDLWYMYFLIYLYFYFVFLHNLLYFHNNLLYSSLFFHISQVQITTKSTATAFSFICVTGPSDGSVCWWPIST